MPILFWSKHPIRFCKERLPRKEKKRLLRAMHNRIVNGKYGEDGWLWILKQSNGTILALNEKNNIKRKRLWKQAKTKETSNWLSATK